MVRKPLCPDWPRVEAMPEAPVVKASSLTMKICLSGQEAVGKSSIVRRFVSNSFDDTYLSTLGAKVSARRFTIPEPGRLGATREVVASVWDIMGNASFRELFKESYFANSQGALLVCDATRPETMHALVAWYDAVKLVGGAIPTVVLVNKSDLKERVRIGAAEADAFCSPRGWKWFATSAKTGEHVEAAFAHVASQYLLKLRGTRGAMAAAP